MVSSFFGLHLASKALAVHQRAMETAGHNIANAYTKGYSRQIVSNTAGEPLRISQIETGFLHMGTGVKISDITRARDIFLDRQVRVQSWVSGRWEMKRGVLSQIENIFAEPSDSGLASSISRFLNSWHDLVSNPESTAIRSTVREQARSMANAFNESYMYMARVQADINENIKAMVTEANTYIEEIAELNEQINEATAVGSPPNDLLDKRDLLVDKLSSLIDIRVVPASNNQVNIFVVGRTLVRESEATTIVADPEPASSALDGQARLVSVVWSDDLTAQVELTDGKIKGLLDLRDTTVVNYAGKLNILADALITEFNGIHGGGYGLNGSTGINFFEGTNAMDIQISQDIIDDLDNIAAAEEDPTSSSGPGDSRNASLLAQLKEGNTHADPDIDGSTYQDYFTGIIASIGVESAEAIRVQENQEFLLAQLEERRQSVSGVSIDEEMANMIMYQRAYEASARVVTIMDEMLEIIINRMGLAGR